MFETINCGSFGIKTLRYNGKAQKILESETTGEVLFGEKQKCHYADSMVGIERSRTILDYVFYVGLLHQEKDVTPDKASEYLDEYFVVDETDDGQKLRDLYNLITAAILRGYGIDPKKLQARVEAEKKRIQEEADKKAMEIIQEKKKSENGKKQEKDSKSSASEN